MGDLRMKKRIQPIICMLVFMLGLLGLAGCGQKNDSEEAAEVVFSFNGQDVTLGEVYIYAKTVQEDYVATYGSDVWSMEVTLEDGSTAKLEEVTRQDIIDDIVRVKVLCVKANDMGIALTETEKEATLSEADSFWRDLTDEQIQSMQLTEELVQETLLENALADKTYQSIISQAEIEVSDETARETTFYDMYFECYQEDENGNIEAYSDEDKQLQYEKALQAYSTLIDPIGTEWTGNIESLAEYYGLEHSSYYTMTPEKIEEVYGEDICEDLYKLEDGSYSLVTETEYGYHIFYMQALTDREATDANKAKLTKEKEQSYFAEQYDQWMKDVDKKFSYEDSVDMEVYGQIVF
jgi:hypothetical protein